MHPAVAQALSLDRDEQLGGVPWHEPQPAPVQASAWPPPSWEVCAPPEDPELLASLGPPPLLLPPPSSPPSSDAGSTKPDPGLGLAEQPAASALAASTAAATPLREPRCEVFFIKFLGRAKPPTPGGI
jgi:hypothetical protein